VILFTLALAAFLPAHWFSIPDWRVELAKLGVHLPDAVSPQPWITLQSTSSDPSNLNAGLALYFAQMREGCVDDALTTQQSLAEVRGRPKYLACMEAELWAHKGEWPKAWTAWQRYDPVKL